MEKKADLKEADTMEIIERVENVVADWPTYARQWGVSNASMQEVAQALKAVRL